ncbi:MAG: hypothetical protein ACOY0T_28450 [Myxococcota bacterium]
MDDKMVAGEEQHTLSNAEHCQHERGRTGYGGERDQYRLITSEQTKATESRSRSVTKIVG